jgi:hypothetical protein
MEKKYVNYIQNERDCSEAQNNEGSQKYCPSSISTHPYCLAILRANKWKISPGIFIDMYMYAS